MAGCLSSDITAVSKTYSGDGKVLVVLHSMGGLATLYAATKNGVGAHLGGVIIFEYLVPRVPFGDTGIAGFFARAQKHGETFEDLSPLLHIHRRERATLGIAQVSLSNRDWDWMVDWPRGDASSCPTGRRSPADERAAAVFGGTSIGGYFTAVSREGRIGLCAGRVVSGGDE